MNIFLSFLQSTEEYPIPAYKFWLFYIKNGIEEAGYQWSECPDVDWALGLIPKNEEDHAKWKEDTWSKTVKWLKKNPADIFLSYLYPHQIDESAISEIRKIGIPCVNFFCDNVREFVAAPKEYSVFDLNWVPEHKAIKFYQKAGYKYVHLPMPVWVLPEDRIIKEERFNQVTFLGSRDIQRQNLLEEIIRLNKNLPLVVYGAGWDKTNYQLNPTSRDSSFVNRLQNQFDFLKRQGIKAYYNKIQSRGSVRAISPGLLEKCAGGHQVEQYKILTAESMITVGINRYPSFRFSVSHPDTYSRLRDIEAPMMGACYLTEWTEGIEELYDTRNEIYVYKTPDEFISVTHELMSNPQKRKSLKVNGQKRALKEYSIANSLKTIIQKLN